MAVHADDAVTHHQPALPLQGKAIHKRGDNGNPDLCSAKRQAHRNNKAQQKIHKRSGAQDDNFFPALLPGKCPGIAGVLILPLHGAVAADRESPKGVKGFSFSLRPQSRAHADSKLIHLYPQQFCGDKVAELMDGNEHSKQHNDQQNIQESRQNGSPHTLINRLAGGAVSFKNIVQLWIVQHGNPVQRRFHQAGNVQKRDLIL